MRDSLKDVQRQKAASPNAEDFAKEAGAVVQYDDKGGYTATVKGEKNILRAIQMQQGARNVEVERGAKLASRRTTETLVSDSGKQFEVPAHLAPQMAKKNNLHAKAYWGRPTERWVVRGSKLVKVF